MPVKIKRKATKSKKGIDINNVIKILINNGNEKKQKKTKKNKKSKINKKNLFKEGPKKGGGSTGSSENINNLLVNKALSDNNTNKLIQSVLLAMKDKPATNDKNTIENLENKTIVKLLNSGDYKELSKIYPRIRAPLEKLVKELNDTGEQLIIEQSRKDKLLLEYENVKNDYQEQEQELIKLRKNKSVSEIEKKQIDEEIYYIGEQLDKIKDEYEILNSQKKFTESELNKSIKLLEKQNKHIEKVNIFFDDIKEGIKEDIKKLKKPKEIENFFRINKMGEELEDEIKAEEKRFADNDLNELKQYAKDNDLYIPNATKTTNARNAIVYQEAAKKTEPKLLNKYEIKFDDEPIDEEMKGEEIIFDG